MEISGGSFHSSGRGKLMSRYGNHITQQILLGIFHFQQIWLVTGDVIQSIPQKRDKFTKPCKWRYQQINKSSTNHVAIMLSTIIFWGLSIDMGLPNNVYFMEKIQSKKIFENRGYSRKPPKFRAGASTFPNFEALVAHRILLKK